MVGPRPEPPKQRLRARIATAIAARLDDLRLALSALGAHRMRSGLTLLGIVIGVFTVVAMMSLLNGLQASIDKNMGGLGADVFQIQRLPNFNFGALSPEIQRRKNITLLQTLEVRQQLPQAKQVGGEVWEGGKEVVVGDNQATGVQVAGGTPEFFSNNNLPIGTGRGYNEAEAMGAGRVCVLGAGVVDILFPFGSPVGQHVRLGRFDLEVIGTIERQGGSPFGGNPDNLISIPIGLFFQLYGTGRSLNITVMAERRTTRWRGRRTSRSAPFVASAGSTPRPTTTSTSSRTTRAARPSISSPAPSPPPAS